MTIETKTVTEITVKKEDVYQQICEEFSRQIAEYQGKPDLIEATAEELLRVVRKLHMKDLKQICNEGYTPVVFPKDVFTKIREFFRGQLNNENRFDHILNVVIEDQNLEYEVIPMDYLRY